MSEDEMLKPCPFCGEKAEIVNGSGIRFTEWLVLCTGDCPVSPSVRKETPEEAIAAWNTRTGEHAAYERGKAEGREAERGRIRAALENAQAKTAWEGSQEIADPDGLHPAYWDGADTAFDEAINIVNQE